MIELQRQTHKAIQRAPHGIILLCLLAVTGALCFLMTSAGADEGKSAASQKDKKTVKFVVYYFHNTFRCFSCNTIEVYTKESVLGDIQEINKKKEPFRELLKAGTLSFKSLNADDKDNKALLKKLKAHSKNVVIAEELDGKILRSAILTDIGKYLPYPARYTNYVRGEIRKFIENRDTAENSKAKKVDKNRKPLKNE